MKGKNNRRNNYFSKKVRVSKIKVVDNFLRLAATELIRAENEAIENVLKTGFSQNKKILNGFIEVRVRPARNGEVIVNRKLDEKALMKAILKKEREIKERRK